MKPMNGRDADATAIALHAGAQAGTTLRAQAGRSAWRGAKKTKRRPLCALRGTTAPDAAGQDTTIVSFLDALGHRDGILELRLIEKNVRPCTRRFVLNNSIDAKQRVISELLIENEARPSMLVFSVNARRRRGGHDADVATVRAVVIDLDGKGPSLRKQEQLLHRFIRLCPATAEVRSGSPGHRHVYWVFESPCEPEQARALVKRLRSRLRADATEPPSKMMRLPGSLNWKSDPPRRIEIARLDPGCLSTPEQFEQALDTVGAPLVGKPSSRPAVEPRFNRKGTVLPTRVGALVGWLPDRLRQLILKGWSRRSGYPSRSEADMAAVRGLVEVGATDAEIAHVFAAYAIGSKYRQSGAAYLDRTIANVRGSESPAGTIAHVFVERISCESAARPTRSRLVLGLRILDGPDAGQSFSHGVTVREAIWKYLWQSAGRMPPPIDEVSSRYRELVNSTLRVRLVRISWNGNDRPEVKAFLPRVLGQTG